MASESLLKCALVALTWLADINMFGMPKFFDQLPTDLNETSLDRRLHGIWELNGKDQFGRRERTFVFIAPAGGDVVVPSVSDGNYGFRQQRDFLPNFTGPIQRATVVEHSAKSTATYSYLFYSFRIRDRNFAFFPVIARDATEGEFDYLVAEYDVSPDEFDFIFWNGQFTVEQEGVRESDREFLEVGDCGERNYLKNVVIKSRSGRQSLTLLLANQFDIDGRQNAGGGYVRRGPPVKQSELVAPPDLMPPPVEARKPGTS
ncbi:hypothetical protein [Stratiformator vulcanicus]|uniref:Uncharacterized protein n=1 Tax=Stratiformator vulcanicus TaxID=2527980 RepID=A0A517R1E8_9PLAN|nr:hypothetical protein [Stratiformator vulcanicus]QDT37660.1 hypothetical protein Pan189_20400 [Stratiformator vulcanicus]